MSGTNFNVTTKKAAAQGADANLKRLTSDEADGASAVGFKMTTDSTLSTSGAKLLSIKNNTIEKFAIDKDGAWSIGDGTLLGSISRIQLKEVTDTNTDGVELSNGDDNGDFIIKGGWNEWNNVIIDTRDADMTGDDEQGWLLVIRNGGPTKDAFHIGADNYGDANVIDFMQTGTPANRDLRISGVYGLEWNGTHASSVDLWARDYPTIGGDDKWAKITLKSDSLSDTSMTLEVKETVTGPITRNAKIVIDTDAKTQYMSGVPNGASAIGHEFSTYGALSTAGSRLASFQNQSTEKVMVDKDGFIYYVNQDGYLRAQSVYPQTGGYTFGGILLRNSSSNPGVELEAFHDTSNDDSNLQLYRTGYWMFCNGTNEWVEQIAVLTDATGAGRTDWRTRSEVESGTNWVSVYGQNNGGYFMGGSGTTFSNLTEWDFLSLAKDTASSVGYWFDTSVALTTSGALLAGFYNNGTVKASIDKDGNTDLVGELKIKVYSQAAEPTLTADSRMAMWIDTDDSNKVYLIFRRGTGDHVKVQLA